MSTLVPEVQFFYRGPLCLLCGFTEDNAIRRRQLGWPPWEIPLPRLTVSYGSVRLG